MHVRSVDGVDVTFFADAAEWADWLAEHHASSPGLWMGLNKAHAATDGTERGLVWADAVVEALRFGWIDSQVRRIDDDAVRQRWTPRRPGSRWSAVNLATVERLLAEGRMEPAGLAVYRARRPENEATYSFESADEPFTDAHRAMLEAEPRALVFWELATEGYRTVCRHWVASAKQQATRDRRMAQLVACCAAGELVPMQRYGTPPAWLARARAGLGLNVRQATGDRARHALGRFGAWTTNDRPARRAPGGRRGVWLRPA